MFRQDNDTERAAQDIIEAIPHLRRTQLRERNRREIDRLNERDRQRRTERRAWRLQQADWDQPGFREVMDALRGARDLAGEQADPQVLAELQAMGVEPGPVIRGGFAWMGHGPMEGFLRPQPAAGSQNVHDRSVNSSSLPVVQRLMALNVPEPANLTAYVHTRLLLADVSSRTMTDATSAISAIISRSSRDVSTDVTESVLLGKVLGRLQQLVNQRVIQPSDAWTTVALQLAEMVEFGTTVCPKGRFQHIAAITQGLDPEAGHIVDGAAVRELILSKAAAVRDEYIGTTAAFAQLYADDDMVFIHSLKAHMRATLAEAFHDMLTPFRLQRVINEALEGI